MLNNQILKKDRYRPRFCQPSFYETNQFLFTHWKNIFQNLSLTEKVQAWVIALTCLRRPTDWFGGIRTKPLKLKQDQFAINPHSLTVSELFNNTTIRTPKKISESWCLRQLLASVLIKPLPETCLHPLFQMSDPHFPLEIISFVPTPLELLNLQIQGRRVITFHENFESWPNDINNDRDFLSFIIHDLIHADHFFKSTQQRQGQLGFYLFIKKIMNDSHLQKLLTHPVFKIQFEYMISDMNSHPVHLFKTFRAITNQTLQNDELSNQIWNSWTKVLGSLVANETNSALQKINTQLFSNTDALSLEELCIALGHEEELGAI